MTFIKGQKAWNRGKPLSASHKKNWYKSLMATPHTHTQEWRELMKKKMTGRKMPPRSIEHAKKLSDSCKGRKAWNKGIKNLERSGENHHNWKGGTTILRERERKSIDYKQWRERVFFRDDYTCQRCGERGGKLNADHELPWSLFPALRFEVLNGRTLCEECHKKTDTYLEKVKTSAFAI